MTLPEKYQPATMLSLLNPFIYKYTLKGNSIKSFELWFVKENFCHLLGLETMPKVLSHLKSCIIIKAWMVGIIYMEKMKMVLF